MHDNNTKTYVDELPNCSFCKSPTLARYDGKTIFGAWGYMCEVHMSDYGKGLGLGKGQELILKPL